MLLSHYIWRSSEAACHVFKVSVAAVLLLSAWDLFGILLLQKGIFWLNCSHSHQAGRMFWAQMLSWMLDFMEMFQENFLDQHFKTNRFLYLHMWRLGVILSPQTAWITWDGRNCLFGWISLPCISSIDHRCLCFHFECAFLRTSVTCVAVPKVHLCLCAASVEAVAAHTQHCSEKRDKKKN